MYNAVLPLQPGKTIENGEREKKWSKIIERKRKDRESYKGFGGVKEKFVAEDPSPVLPKKIIIIKIIKYYTLNYQCYNEKNIYLTCTLCLVDSEERQPQKKKS